MDRLQTPVGAEDTLVALAEQRTGPAVAAAHTVAAQVAEAHIVPALVLAAERLADLGRLRPPGRFARHSQLPMWLRISCKIFGPEGTLCHKRGKTL